ncbi:hypothetical protein MA16_Dca009061 [Dendrobium catenatum]|uniref:Uncharacterized protein n=1 Tax=Dendrobium catenatum TaxID=906689 RepID=A0A2I0VRE6_9ASPA|nr:hypothetical protein MA16_Dca009061 [Dendrobium catenatum]
MGFLFVSAFAVWEGEAAEPSGQAKWKLGKWANMNWPKRVKWEGGVVGSVRERSNFQMVNVSSSGTDYDMVWVKGLTFMETNYQISLFSPYNGEIIPCGVRMRELELQGNSRMCFASALCESTCFASHIKEERCSASYNCVNKNYMYSQLRCELPTRPYKFRLTLEEWPPKVH